MADKLSKQSHMGLMIPTPYLNGYWQLKFDAIGWVTTPIDHDDDSRIMHGRQNVFRRMTVVGSRSGTGWPSCHQLTS